jgi:opacity protein-like surface antigen
MFHKKGMYQKLFFILLINIMSSQKIFSADNHFVVTLSGGPLWENNHQAQTVYMSPDILKIYTAKNSTETLATGELFLGIQHPLNPKLQNQIGLSVATMSSAKVSGDIWDDGDSQFNNYTYQYFIKHFRVSVREKLLMDWGYTIYPWVSASVGIGFNRSYQFSSTPTISEALPTPYFPNYTQTAFTYSLGFGFQRLLNKNWQLGIGYEFADWGKNKLAQAQGQTLSTSLSLPHFYTQTVLINITYLA